MPTVKNTSKSKATMPKPNPAPTPKPVPPKPVPNPAPVAPKPVPPNQPTPVPNPAPQPAPTSLTKSNIPIPAFLQQVAMPQTSDRQTSGYVGFASTQSKKWTQQQQAGLEDGQPFLFHQQAYIPLETLEFFLCMGTSFQTMMAGKAGEFIYVTRDMEVRMDDVIHKGNVCKLDPHYVCLLLVNLNGSLIPIKGDFRGTKSGGMENAIRAVDAASSPDWLRLSEQHKATAAFPQPFGRVYNEITTKRQVSKRNGNSYFTADCNPSPATVSQMQLLVSHFKDEAFINALTEAKTNFDARIQFLDNVKVEEVS